MAARRSPEVSVVVCTRDRGSEIVGTIDSVLANDFAEFELIVIDQSTSDATSEAVEPFLSDERIRYIRTQETGVSRSRNRSLSEARCEFVLNTDDDCVVAPDWIAVNVRALAAAPNAAIVFGDVIAPDVQASEFYTPESKATSDFVVRSIWSWKSTDGANVGIGASMAMRKSMLTAIGGFDTCLGPGSELKNAEDTDISLRAVLAGYELVRTRAVHVTHFGARHHDEYRRLMRATMLGVGAVNGKLFRRHPAAASWYFLGLAWSTIARVVIVDLAHLRKPPVLGRARYLVKGLALGLRKPLQPGPALLFEEPAEVSP
ncbi:MAG: glycosyltransferase family A protein [Ilumatobacteraceae bacterium]